MTLPPFKSKHQQQFGAFIIIIIGILIMLIPTILISRIQNLTSATFILGAIAGVIGLFYFIDAL